jgi:hypothetical protein
MFFSDRVPGFEPFHNGSGLNVTLEVVRTKLTQALGMDKYFNME